jgi:hypothetical protein
MGTDCGGNFLRVDSDRPGNRGVIKLFFRAFSKVESAGE